MTEVVSAAVERPGEDQYSQNEVTAVILSAGYATRLGPASAMGKAAMRVTDAPVLALQLKALLAGGYDRVVLVLRPEHETHVRPILERYSEACGLQWQIVVQSDADGPGAAFLRAVEECRLTGPVLLQLGDTLLGSIPDRQESDWLAVAETDARRRWCCVEFSSEDMTVTGLRDEVPAEGATVSVAVGMYQFSKAELLSEETAVAVDEQRGEAELSDLLLRYAALRPLRARVVDGWVDVGDMAGVARASADMLRHRPHHSFQMRRDGMLVKRGISLAEEGFYRRIKSSSSALFPHILEAADGVIVQEYLDYPSLAYLFLYVSIAPRAWADMLLSLIGILEEQLWPLRDDESVRRESLAASCAQMYIGKTRERRADYAKIDPIAEARSLTINGVPCVAGEPLIERLCGELEELCSRPLPAHIHGDLCFSNILRSPQVGIFRLIDPRGEFGETGLVGDIRYEYAKLRQSYHGGYDQILHGIFSIDCSDFRDIVLQVSSFETVGKAVDKALLADPQLRRDVALIEAALFLSMPTFHADCPGRAQALYVRGVELANAVLTSS